MYASRKGIGVRVIGLGKTQLSQQTRLKVEQIWLFVDSYRSAAHGLLLFGLVI